MPCRLQVETVAQHAKNQTWKSRGLISGVCLGLLEQRRTKRRVALVDSQRLQLFRRPGSNHISWRQTELVSRKAHPSQTRWRAGKLSGVPRFIQQTKNGRFLKRHIGRFDLLDDGRCLLVAPMPRGRFAATTEQRPHLQQKRSSFASQ